MSLKYKNLQNTLLFIVLIFIFNKGINAAPVIVINNNIIEGINNLTVDSIVYDVTFSKPNINNIKPVFMAYNANNSIDAAEAINTVFNNNLSVTQYKNDRLAGTYLTIQYIVGYLNYSTFLMPYLDSSYIVTYDNWFPITTQSGSFQLNEGIQRTDNYYSGLVSEQINFTIVTTPIPPAIWLVGSALGGLLGFTKRKIPELRPFKAA